MLFVPPQKPIILQSNVPQNESGIEQFNPDTNYMLGATVQYLNDIFESLADNNQGNTPISEKTSLHWEFKRKSNYLAMFDDKMSTATINDVEITYQLQASDIDVICFFGLEAKSVKIELLNSDNAIVYSKELETFDREVTDWVSWTVAELEYTQIAFFRDIPFLFEGKLNISILNEGSIAKCTHCVFGASRDAGVTVLNTKPTSSIRNVLSKTKNDDGSVSTTNSMTYKRITANVLVETSRVSYIQNFLEKYTVSPLLCLADEREDGVDSLICFGYYKDFDIPIGLDHSEYILEMEGIV